MGLWQSYRWGANAGKAKAAVALNPLGATHCAAVVLSCQASGPGNSSQLGDGFRPARAKHFSDKPTGQPPRRTRQTPALNDQRPRATGPRAARRFDAAWHQLYDAYAEAVWRCVARRVGPHAAEVADIVQETFLAAARSARTFDPAQGSCGSGSAASPAARPPCTSAASRRGRKQGHER